MVDVPENEYDDRINRAELAREEARETIQEQTTTLSDIDEKAIQLFRVNIVFASILASGVSIAVSTDNATANMLLTSYTKTGALFLFISTIFASITYTSTSERIGISRDDIEERILNQRYDYDLVEEGIAIEYGKWIRYNYERNATNALLFTLTLIASVGSICYVAIGLVDIYNDAAVTPKINFFVLGFFLIFGKLSGVYGQSSRWWKETSPDERFNEWCIEWLDKLQQASPEDGGEDPDKGNDGEGENPDCGEDS